MIQSLQEEQQIQGEAASEDLRVHVSKRHIEDILSFKFGEPSQEMRRFISNSKSDKEAVIAIFQAWKEQTPVKALASITATTTPTLGQSKIL